MDRHTRPGGSPEKSCTHPFKTHYNLNAKKGIPNLERPTAKPLKTLNAGVALSPSPCARVLQGGGGESMINWLPQP